jgi:hypothetical protein
LLPDLLPIFCGARFLLPDLVHRRAEGGVELLDHLTLDAGQQMTVRVHRRLDLGMARSLADRLHRGLLRDQLADMAVAQAVDVNTGEASLPRHVEQRVAEAGRSDWCPVTALEYQAAVLICLG